MSSNSSSPNANALLAQSMKTLNAQWGCSVSWTVLSVLAIIIGGLQLFTTAFWKPLRKPEQSIITALAITDLLKSFAFAALAIRRLVETSLGLGDVGTQFRCMIWQSAIDFPLNIGYFLIITLSLDRLLALATPHWYKHWKPKLKLAFVGFSVVVGCAFTCLTFIGSHDGLIAVCAHATAPPQLYRDLQKSVSIASAAASSVINVVCCALLIIRWRAARKMKTDMKTFKRSIQFNALKILLAVCLVFLVTTVTHNLWSIVLSSISSDEAFRLSMTPMSISFEILRGVLDFPLYIIMAKEYRSGFIDVILKRRCVSPSNQVSNIFTVEVRSMHQTRTKATTHS